MKISKKTFVGVCVVIIVCVVGVAFRSRVVSTPVQYQTAVVEKGSIVVTVTAAGQVSTAHTRTVDTNVTGMVKKVFVKDGERVTQGQVLAEVELDQSAQQAYLQALSSYQSAKNALASAQASQYTLQASMFTAWDTYKVLSESDLYKETNADTRQLAEFQVKQKQWLAAEAAFKNQQAVLTQAQSAVHSAYITLQLVSSKITAPMSGTLAGFSLQPAQVIGTSTTTTQTIAQILTDAAPSVVVNLTEADVQKVHNGDQATMTLDAVADKSFTGKVVSIDTVGSISSGVVAYPVVIVFDTAAGVFPNMSVQVSIITDAKQQVLTIPISAMTTSGEQKIVQVLTDGKVEQRTIQTGITSSTVAEVLGGVAEGEQIITSSTSSVNGTKQSQTTSPFSSFGRGGFGGGGAVRISR